MRSLITIFSRTLGFGSAQSASGDRQWQSAFTCPASYDRQRAASADRQRRVRHQAIGGTRHQARSAAALAMEGEVDVVLAPATEHDVPATLEPSREHDLGTPPSIHNAATELEQSNMVGSVTPARPSSSHLFVSTTPSIVFALVLIH